MPVAQGKIDQLEDQPAGHGGLNKFGQFGPAVHEQGISLPGEDDGISQEDVGPPGQGIEPGGKGLDIVVETPDCSRKHAGTRQTEDLGKDLALVHVKPHRYRISGGEPMAERAPVPRHSVEEFLVQMATEAGLTALTGHESDFQRTLMLHYTSAPSYSQEKGAWV